MIVIGLVGAKSAGKTTVAQHLMERHGFSRERFAAPLKEMLVALGLSYRQLEGDEREVPCDLLCGKTPRYAMQKLGTEWRDMIGTELWTKIMHRRLNSHQFRSDAKIVIDDVRFYHEVGLIRTFPNRLWRVRRESVEPITYEHESERYWRDFMVDKELFNSGTEDDLRKLVDLSI